MGFQGMDPDQVRTLAQHVRSARQRLGEQQRRLHSEVTSSAAAWHGPDGDEFRHEWGDALRAAWRTVDAQLEAAGRLLEQQADEQDSASAEEGRSPSIDAGAAPDLSSGTTMLDGGGSGDIVAPDVSGAWHVMTPEERRRVLQVVVNDERAKYGLPPVTIDYFSADPSAGKGAAYGSWDGTHLRINTFFVDDPRYTTPRMLLVAVHEVRHSAQKEFMERTEPGFWDFLPWVDSTADDYEEIEEKYGVPPEEIEEWRKNDEHYISPEEDAEGYKNQPLEVDARDAAKKYNEDLTLERMQEIQRRAGVKPFDP